MYLLPATIIVVAATCRLICSLVSTPHLSTMASTDDDDILIVNENISAPALPARRAAEPARADVIDCLSDDEDSDAVNEVVADEATQEGGSAKCISMDCCGKQQLFSTVQGAVAMAAQGELCQAMYARKHGIVAIEQPCVQLAVCAALAVVLVLDSQHSAFRHTCS